MTDQKSDEAVKEVVETETTQTDSPQVESPTTGDETDARASDDQGAVTESSDDLPETEEERRKAFQKQRQEIKRLKEEARSREGSAFDAFRPQVPPVSQPAQVRVEDYTDPATGITDWSAYNNAVNGAIQQGVQHASFVARQTADEVMDESNARSKFSEVMSNPELEQEVADRWFAAKMRGENPSISDIAKLVDKRERQTAFKAEKIGQEKAFNEVSEKEQAGLSSQGQTTQGASSEASAEEMENLRYRTRIGDQDAITARISKIPWVNK